MSSSDEFAIPTTILRHFDLSSSPYTETAVSEIRGRRAAYPDGKLFLDQLLAFAEIDGPSLYPPTTPAALRRLLHAIQASPLDRLKQDSFLYYLLLDYDKSSSELSSGHVKGMDLDGSEADVKPKKADQFARRRCLPRTWRVFMDGYWALDHEDWDTAVACLSDPCISDINFVPQILTLLSTHPSPPSRALSLINTFLSYTFIQLSTPAETDIKLLALASAGSLSQAFEYIRNFDDEAARSRMREALWCWALGAPKVSCGSGQKGANPRVIKQLLHLPLSPEEHSHLLQFLTHPPRSIPPQSLSALHDLVTLRLVHQGQYAESIQLDRESTGSAGSDLDRQRRREMVREFISILPETQRRALAVEGDERVLRKDKERAEMVNGYKPTTTTDVDMGDSWVDIPQAQPPAQIIAPVPQHFDSTLNIAKSTALPSSPAPASPAPARHSPFTGPPRFASTQQSPALLQRVLSGSPFALPRNVSLGSPAPKGPRRIINDDDAPTEPTLNRHRQQSTRSTVPPDSPKSAKPPSEQQPRRSQRERVVSGPSKPTEPKEASPTPASAPASPPPRRTRTKAPATPSSRRTTMPGTFDPVHPEESVPEENEEEDQVPPTPSTKKGGPGGVGNPPQTGGRSRITRSASRAVLDEEPSTEQPKSKRTRRSARETTVEETPARSTRRSTRTRGSTAQPSDRGSPTPSVAASVGGRSEGGKGRRRVRESSIMSTASQTPRATRSRK